jgi:hypothetical protein
MSIQTKGSCGDGILNILVMFEANSALTEQILPKPDIARFLQKQLTPYQENQAGEENGLDG